MKLIAPIIALLVSSIPALIAAPIVPKPIVSEPGLPVEAIDLLVAAAKTGDADKFEERLGGHARSAFKLRRVEDAWHKAADERFGPQKDSEPRKTISDELIHFAGRKYQVWSIRKPSDRRYELTVWVIETARGVESIREEIWTALLDERTWLLVPSDRGYLEKATRINDDGRKVEVTVVKGSEPGDAKREVRFSQAKLEAYQRSIDAVKDGRYLNRSEANQGRGMEYQEVMERFFSQKR